MSIRDGYNAKEYALRMRERGVTRATEPGTVYTAPTTCQHIGCFRKDTSWYRMPGSTAAYRWCPTHAALRLESVRVGPVEGATKDVTCKSCGGCGYLPGSVLCQECGGEGTIDEVTE